MIDYEKLKIAHDFAEKYARQLDSSVRILCNFNPGIYEYDLSAYNLSMSFKNIDTLIAKLSELSNSAPKFQIGQEVWFLYMGFEINKFKITDIFLNDQTEWEYDNVPENDLYTTKKALIDAQIEYWKSLEPKCSYGYSYCECDNDVTVKESLHTCCAKCKEEWSKCVCKDGGHISTYKKPDLSGPWEVLLKTTLKPFECQHKSDGVKYQRDQPTFSLDGTAYFPPPHNKCRICGEFYK